MTRKDYVAIAAVIANVRSGESLAERGYVTVPVVDNLTDQLVDVLIADNPNFNKDRFLEAVRGTAS